MTASILEGRGGDSKRSAQARQILERSASLLRLPTYPDGPPEVLGDGSGLRCPATGRLYAYSAGVLDLLGDKVELTATQRMLDTRLTAWLYDRFRDLVLPALGLPTFPSEVASIQARLDVRPGDTVLDLACGHGNFTVEWAKRVGPGGLVIGLDISPAMTARAARHVREWGLKNVLLVRGDALHLPLGDNSILKVNCSGGFHQFPDLPQALREIARITKSGGVLTASTFAEGPNDRRAQLKRWVNQRLALHFVPLDWLGEELTALGYRAYRWSLPGGWFGYASALK